MDNFEILEAQSISEAAEQTASGPEQSLLMAGGTDLLGQLKDYLYHPKRVVNLKTIKDGALSEIRETKKTFEIGALVKLAALAKHDGLNKIAALGQSLAKTATPQIKNLGTVGGNLCQRPRCWYFRHEDYVCLKKGGSECYSQDGENEYHAVLENMGCNIVHPSNLAPVFLACDAQFEIVGAKSTRLVAASDFFTGPEVDVLRENILKPGEILTRVIIPKAMTAWRSSYLETRERQAFDWALCGATVALKKSADGRKIEDIRVVLSAVAPRPLLRDDLGLLLRGHRPTAGRLKKVAEAAVAEATPMTQNSYKIPLIKVLLTRAIEQAWEMK